MNLTPDQMAYKVHATHGLIANNAALADSSLYAIFQHFFGSKRELARAIYFTFDSIVARISLTKRIAVAGGANEEVLTLIGDLGDAVKDAMNHRNGFAHSFLIVQEVYGLDDHIRVINPKSGGVGRHRVTEESLASAEMHSANHLKKVAAAFRAVCEKLGIPPEVTI